MFDIEVGLTYTDLSNNTVWRIREIADYTVVLENVNNVDASWRYFPTVQFSLNLADSKFRRIF